MCGERKQYCGKRQKALQFLLSNLRSVITQPIYHFIPFYMLQKVIFLWFFHLSFLSSTGVWIQVFTLARQVLCLLIYTSSPPLEYLTCQFFPQYSLNAFSKILALIQYPSIFFVNSYLSVDSWNK
jgi:hypothetical protein